MLAVSSAIIGPGWHTQPHLLHGVQRLLNVKYVDVRVVTPHCDNVPALWAHLQQQVLATRVAGDRSWGWYPKTVDARSVSKGRVLDERVLLLFVFFLLVVIYASGVACR
jgi:hypothetical protein